MTTIIIIMENFEGQKVYKLIHSPNFPYGNNLVISVVFMIMYYHRNRNPANQIPSMLIVVKM